MTIVKRLGGESNGNGCDLAASNDCHAALYARDPSSPPQACPAPVSQVLRTPSFPEKSDATPHGIAFFMRRSFPLNCSRWLATNVIRNSIHTFYFIDNACGNAC